MKNMHNYGIARFFTIYKYYIMRLGREGADSRGGKGVCGCVQLSLECATRRVDPS